MLRPSGETGIRLHDKSLTFIAEDETLRPLRDWLLIEPINPQDSAILETHWHGEAVKGKVLAAGPGKNWNIHSRFRKDGKEQRTVRPSKVFRPTEVKPGDVVELGGRELKGYLWKHVNYHGKDCVLCMEADVCGVHDGGP